MVFATFATIGGECRDPMSYLRFATRGGEANVFEEMRWITNPSPLQTTGGEQAKAFHTAVV